MGKGIGIYYVSILTCSNIDLTCPMHLFFPDLIKPIAFVYFHLLSTQNYDKVP